MKPTVPTVPAPLSPVAPVYRLSVITRPVYVPPKSPIQRPTYSAPGCVIRSGLDKEELK